MAKFLRGIVKDVNAIADMANIPALKSQRNALEAERDESVEKLKLCKVLAELMKPLFSQLPITLEANQRICSDMLLLFQGANFIPKSTPEEVLLVEDQQLRTFNGLYNQLLQMNIAMGESIIYANGSDIQTQEARIEDLNRQIQNLNDKLNRIRQK